MPENEFSGQVVRWNFTHAVMELSQMLDQTVCGKIVGKGEVQPFDKDKIDCPWCKRDMERHESQKAS